MAAFVNLNLFADERSVDGKEVHLSPEGMPIEKEALGSAPKYRHTYRPGGHHSSAVWGEFWVLLTLKPRMLPALAVTGWFLKDHRAFPGGNLHLCLSQGSAGIFLPQLWAFFLTKSI